MRLLLNNILKNKDQFEQSDLEWLEKQDEQYCHEVKVALFAVEQAPLSLLSFNDFMVLDTICESDLNTYDGLMSFKGVLVKLLSKV